MFPGKKKVRGLERHPDIYPFLSISWKNIFESGVKHLTSNGQMMDQTFVYIVHNIKHLWVIMWELSVASHWQTLSHNVLSSTPRHWF
jgi:hypothetical protein